MIIFMHNEVMTTIFDVAKLANVSIKTVSRAYNEQKKLKKETLLRVKKAIKKLHYIPHRGAQIMRSNKSGLCGLITDAISTDDGPFQSGLSSLGIVQGVQHSLKQYNKTVLMADTNNDPEEISKLIRSFSTHKVEGIIISTSKHIKIKKINLKMNIPIVLVNCYSDNEFPSILPDDYEAQKSITQKMIQSSHRNIAMVGLNNNSSAGKLRKKAFIDTCIKFGLNKSEFNYVPGVKNYYGKFKSNDHLVIEEALEKILSIKTLPSAICFGNDMMAMKALPIMEKKGIKVPRDISIWGFDNDTAVCNFSHPTLSTISLPYYEMGLEAGHALLHQINKNTKPFLNKLICGKIVFRQSSLQNIKRQIA